MGEIPDSVTWYNVRPPFDSVQLVPKNSNVTMVYGIYNELVTGANLNQQTSLGGGHIVGYG